MSETPSQPQGSALVLFSGGQDSATCLAWALDRFARVETVGFDYGQRHSVELEARLRVLEHLPRLKPEWAGRLGEDHSIDIRGFGQIASSAKEVGRSLPDSTPVAGTNWICQLSDQPKRSLPTRQK